MKNCIVAFLFLTLSLPFNLAASERDVSELSTRERIFVGGFIGAQFGNISVVSINLHAGYRLTNRLSAGIGGSYQYANYAWFQSASGSHTYGGSVFARYNVYSEFFLHAEAEMLSLQSRLPSFDVLLPDRQRISESNYLVGAGYGFPVSERIRLNMLLLYNINDGSKAYLDNPFFRIGIDVYLF